MREYAQMNADIKKVRSIVRTYQWEPALANECYLQEPDHTVELLAPGSAGSLSLNQEQHQILGWLRVQMGIQKPLEKGQEEMGP